MGINRAENAIDKRLVSTVTKLERDMRELKSKQPIGADALTVVSVPAGAGAFTVGPVFIISGSSSTIAITTIPAASRLTLWNFAFTVYVDVLDNAHQWPNGSALTVESREAWVFNWLDWADSSDTLNTRVYKIRIRNSSPGTIDHNYYIQFKAYAPLVQVS